MPDTAALVVALSAQLTKFEQDMNKAVGIADKGVNDIEGKFKKANIEFKGFDELDKKLKGLLTIGGIALLIKQIIDLNEAVAKLGETAETLGVSTDTLQNLRFAAAATGASFDIADRFVEQFARKVQEAATGTGDLYNFLRVNNIEASKFAKLPLNEQVGKYADLIKNSSTQQERLNAAVIASSRQVGPQFVSALQTGAAGLKEFGDELTSLGGRLSESTIQRAKEANEEFQKLKFVLGSFAEIAAVEAFTGLSNVLHGIATAIAEIIQNFQFMKDLMGGAGKLLGIQPGFDYNQDPAKVTVNKGAGTTNTYSKLNDDFQKLIQSQIKRNELLVSEAQHVQDSAGVQAFYKTEIELTNAVLEKNKTISEAQYAEILRVAAATQQAAQQAYNSKQAWEGLNTAVQAFGNQMIDIMIGLTQKTLTASEAMRQLTNFIIKALLQAALLGQGPLGNVLGFGSSTPGGTGGILGGLVSGVNTIFKRAGGGPVTSGHPYVVGEQGPELFVPGSSGQIIPNRVNARSSGSGLSVVVNNYTSQDTATTQERRSGPSGEQLVIGIVRKEMAKGGFDDVNRGRYGLRAVKSR